jgi:hypothetical protein
MTIKEPVRTRAGEQLILQVGDDVFAWGFYSSFTEALAKADAESVRTGLPVRLLGRVRLNDYVGSPIWGAYTEYEITPDDQQ